jgi:hypothetical protein
MTEQIAYYQLLQATQAELPHGRLDVLQATLNKLGAFSKHSLFMAHLASWLVENGELRDQKVLLAANLIADVEWRDVGNAVLQRLSPAEILRTLRYLKGTSEPIKVREERKTRIESVRMGLDRNVPHSTVTALKAYLREKDADMDGVIRSGQGKFLRGIYASLSVKPYPEAQDALFSGSPSHGVAYWLRLLPAMDADAQAETILKHRLPYTQSVGAVKKMTATVLYALISSMTSAQLQHNLASLEKRGAWNTPELRELVEKKLKKPAVASLRQTVAAKAITDEGIKKTLAESEEKQISLRGSINVPVAVLLDKSGSQETAIELSKELLPYLASASKAGLRMWAFDTSAYPIDLPESVTAESTRKALRGIKGSGGTVISSAINALRRSTFVAELLIVLTDEATEDASAVANSLRLYCAEKNVLPSAIIARTPSAYTSVRTGAELAGLAVDAFDVTRVDQYAVGQILRLATTGGKIGIVQTIIEYPLLAAFK